MPAACISPTGVVTMDSAPLVTDAVVLDVDTRLVPPPTVSASVYLETEHGWYDTLSGLTHRRLRPGDMHECVRLHRSLFPIEYEKRFYDAAVHESENVLTLGAFRESQVEAFPEFNGHAPNHTVTQRMIGIVTARVQSRIEEEDKEIGRFLKRDVHFVIGTLRSVWQNAARRLSRRTNRNVYTTHSTSFGGLRSTSVDDVHTPYLYVLTVGVEPEFRRKGLAKQMLERTCQRAKKEKGCAVAYLHVIAHDAGALRLYESLGFEKVCLHADFYRLDPNQCPVPGKARYDAILLGRACVQEREGNNNSCFPDTNGNGNATTSTRARKTRWSPLASAARQWDQLCHVVLNAVFGAQEGRRSTARQRISWSAKSGLE